MSDIRIRFSKKLLGGAGEFQLKIDKSIDFGAFIALSGKSGAGKTSILRILSGLDCADEGYIRVGNDIWLDTQKKIFLPPQKRQIGFVFQNYALFPHLNVYENICFGLKHKNDKTFADELLTLMDLTCLKNTKISQLSGGQSQRIALARAIVRRPKVLLLDEPFSALDVSMRQKLQEELAQIHRHFSLTTILVSHNLSEIFYLASRNFVLQEGQITQDGTCDEIFIQKRLSAKIKLVGEIVRITDEGVLFVIEVLCGNEILKIVYDPKDGKNFQLGEQVVIASKAFNPTIYKL